MTIYHEDSRYYRYRPQRTIDRYWGYRTSDASLAQATVATSSPNQYPIKSVLDPLFYYRIPLRSRRTRARRTGACTAAATCGRRRPFESQPGWKPGFGYGSRELAQSSIVTIFYKFDSPAQNLLKINKTTPRSQTTVPLPYYSLEISLLLSGLAAHQLLRDQNDAGAERAPETLR